MKSFPRHLSRLTALAALSLICVAGAAVLPDDRADLFWSQYKGQVVMVNFWATWCGPCQQEMPLLDQMYKKYKPAGFTLIGVNVDKEGPAVKDLMARKPVSFPVLLDPANQVSKAYHVDEMPSSVIVDRKGEIRYIHRGYRPGDENEYQDRIRQLIRE